VRILLALKWPLLGCAIAAAIAAWLIWSLLPGAGISVVIPDENTFQIAKPGRYTVWTQVEASSQGKLMTFVTGLPPGVTIAITRIDGTTVPLHSQWPTTHRDTATSIQVAVADITFDSPGSYRIAVDGLHEKRALYLDQSDMRAFFLKTFILIALPMVFLGCIAWALVIYFTRLRNRPNHAME
jgi:hypothetical protein